MKIIIANTAVLNTGDAAILSGTIGILRRAFGQTIDVVAYDQQASAAGRYYRGIEFRPILYEQIMRWTGRRWFKPGVMLFLLIAAAWRSPLKTALGKMLPQTLRASMDEFATADLILAAGGTYLVPHYRTFPKILDLLAAWAMRRPFALFTQSLGPFHSSRDRLLKFVLRRARLILVRDKQSRQHLEALGIGLDRVAECADSAFALVESAASASPVPGRPLNVAVSVRDWPHIKLSGVGGMNDYLDAVADAVRWLVEERDASVTFLSTCQGAAEYWTDDSRTAGEVVQRLPEAIRGRVRINAEFHSPYEMLKLIGEFDVVVATRMHMAILAMCAGVPVLPIAYEFKTNELFGGFSLGRFVQHIGSITGDNLCFALARLLDARSAVRDSIRNRIKKECESAFAAGFLVKQHLETEL